MSISYRTGRVCCPSTHPSKTLCPSIAVKYVLQTWVFLFPPPFLTPILIASNRRTGQAYRTIIVSIIPVDPGRFGECRRPAFIYRANFNRVMLIGLFYISHCPLDPCSCPDQLRLNGFKSFFPKEVPGPCWMAKCVFHFRSDFFCISKTYWF